MCLQIHPDESASQGASQTRVTPIVDVTAANHSGKFGGDGYVTLQFPLVSKVTIGFIYTCNWYDEASNTWSPDGCVTAIEMDGSIQCTCNHLTSFAVLADVSASSAEALPISNADSRALSMIT